jgi:hypothetical protein
MSGGSVASAPPVPSSSSNRFMEGFKDVNPKRVTSSHLSEKLEIIWEVKDFRSTLESGLNDEKLMADVKLKFESGHTVGNSWSS